MQESFIEDVTRLVEHIPGPTAIKSKDMKFIYWNREFGQMTGIASPKRINGLTDYDLQNGFALHADLYREHDRHVISCNAPVSELSVIQTASGRIKAYLINRKPVTYHASSPNYVMINMLDVSAMDHHLFDIFHPNYITNNDAKHSEVKAIKYGSAEEKNNLMMTQREREILYYLLRGGTARYIAEILKLSHRTVEQYIGILKDKFFAENKSQLIQNALHLGYFYLVPQSATK